MTQLPATSPLTVPIAEYSDYLGAQSAVDHLSDSGFEVSSVRIVGHDVRTVEAVTGRMTYGKAALYGAGGGAWIGLLIGILFALFAIGSYWSVLLWSVLLGAVWGVIFGLLGFSVTGNSRNFRSEKGLKAGYYTVEVPQERAADAVRLLAGPAAAQGTPGAAPQGTANPGAAPAYR